MKTLGGPILEPQSGQIDRLVIIFHGYGADGENLIDLGEAWAPLLPNTAFLAPNGLSPCEMGFGYQWFPLIERSPAHIQEKLRTVQERVSQFIKDQAQHYGLPLNHVALVGFSQGSMLALHQGVYGLDACAGVVGYSGGFTTDLTLAPKNTPPVLLCHGESDDVVPVDFSRQGHKDLTAMGCAAQLITHPRCAHQIAEEGFREGGAFLKRVLFPLKKAQA